MSILSLSFHVHGVPQPKGSWRAFYPRGSRKANFVADNRKMVAWCATVSARAAAAMRDLPLFTGAVSLRLLFIFPRPRSRRFASGRFGVPHAVKPDKDKLERAVCDALSGIVYRDDSQVAACEKVAVYTSADGGPTGVWITVSSSFGVDPLYEPTCDCKEGR